MAAGKELEKADTRTNAINRALRNVQQLPLDSDDEFASGTESTNDAAK